MQPPHTTACTWPTRQARRRLRSAPFQTAAPEGQARLTKPRSKCWRRGPRFVIACSADGATRQTSLTPSAFPVLAWSTARPLRPRPTITSLVGGHLLNSAVSRTFTAPAPRSVAVASTSRRTVSLSSATRGRGVDLARMRRFTGPSPPLTRRRHEGRRWKGTHSSGVNRMRVSFVLQRVSWASSIATICS